MADKVTQYRQSWVAVDFNLSSEAVTQILVGKLSRTVSDKWEESLERNQFLTLEQSTEFLTRTAFTMSTQKIQFPESPLRNFIG